METLFDLAEDKKTKAEFLNIIIVGSHECPASPCDISEMRNEIIQAKLENRPCFFRQFVRISILASADLPKTVFQLGSCDKPASDEDINDLRKELGEAIKNGLPLVVPHPLNINYMGC